MLPSVLINQIYDWKQQILKEGLERRQLPWINLTDNMEMEGYASLYGIRGIPFYVLISPDGIVEKI